MQNIVTDTVFKRASTFIGKSFLSGICALGLGTLANLSPVALADPGHADECTKVGGGFVTNFIAEDQTAGTATGDLKGSLGVKVLGVISGTIGNGKPVVLKVQHFWVTETGDTILLDQAEATGYPAGSPGMPLLYAAVYENGVKIIGGTGKFEGATGLIKAWGAIDLGGGQVAGRYAGTICFKSPGKN